MQLKVKFIIFLLASFALFSCQPASPGHFPDLGMSVESIQFNTIIRFNVPKEVNTLKLGETIHLELENLSDEIWLFDIAEIQMFRFENNNWQKVKNNILSIGDGEQVETLQPKGSWPGSKALIPIMPDVTSDKMISLRVVILVHNINQEKSEENIVGAFVDITLKP